MVDVLKCVLEAMPRKRRYQCGVSGDTKVCYTANLSSTTVSAIGVVTWGSDFAKDATLSVLC